MNINRTCFFLTILTITMLCVSTINAQSIKGSAFTTENKQPVPLSFATVKLLAAKDSSFVVGTATNEKGAFTFHGLKPLKYILQISCIGYKTTTYDVAITSQVPNVSLGNIQVQENSVQLAEAVVVAQRTEMVVKTDTVEYNADAYRLKENAVVEDLLKRLPGVTVSDDGTIMANGKEIKKIMVDGKDFFKSNPTLAIKNIPVEILEKLQVIDDKSELAKLTGIDDGEENTVINISLKKGKKRGWLINSNAGIGSEIKGSEKNPIRYTVNAFGARLVEESQFGLVANGNNINDLTVGGGSSSSSSTPGLNSSFSGGFNYSTGVDRHDSPLYISTDVAYNYHERTFNRFSSREYYHANDSSSYQQDSLYQWQQAQGVRYSAKINYRKLKNWTISFSSSGNYNINNNNNQGLSYLQKGDEDRTLVNSNNRHSWSKAPNYNINGALTVSRSFDKPRRRLSLTLYSRIGASDSEGYNESNYYYYLVTNPDKKTRILNQKTVANNQTNQNRLTLSYSEPIGKTGSLQFVYWINFLNQNNQKNSFEKDKEGNYTQFLINDYSKSLNNKTISQQIGLTYRGTALKNKIVYSAGVDLSPSLTNSYTYIMNGSYLQSDSIVTSFPDRSILNYAPNGYLLYSISKGTSLRFDYRGRAEAPPINMIDPTRDESNPMLIRVGNPDLLPKFTHWSRLRFVDFNRETQQSIQASVEGNFIENDFVYLTTYDSETGIKTNSPVNQSGTWWVNSFLNYSRPLGQYFQVNSLSGVNFRNKIGFSNLGVQKGDGIKMTASTMGLNEELSLTHKWEWLYTTLKGYINWNNTSYNIESMLPVKTLNWSGSVNLQANLPKALCISTEITTRAYGGFSTDYNRNEIIWNAEISKSFLSNNAATVTLRVNDLLQQQLSVSQVIASNYVEDQNFNTLKSFVMIAFSYKINSLGKK